MKGIKRLLGLFINRVTIWQGKAAGVVGWEQDGNTIHLQIQRYGLFRKWTGMLSFCDITIDPTKVIQPPK